MRPRLRRRQPVPDLQHVGVVVAPEGGRVQLERVLVEDGEDAREARVDVVAHPPRVAGRVAPGLDVGLAPVAEAVEDGAVLGEQRVAHEGVAVGGVGGAVVVAGGAEVGFAGAGAVVGVGGRVVVGDAAGRMLGGGL